MKHFPSLVSDLIKQDQQEHKRKLNFDLTNAMLSLMKYCPSDKERRDI